MVVKSALKIEKTYQQVNQASTHLTPTPLTAVPVLS